MDKEASMSEVDGVADDPRLMPTLLRDGGAHGYGKAGGEGGHPEEEVEAGFHGARAKARRIGTCMMGSDCDMPERWTK